MERRPVTPEDEGFHASGGEWYWTETSWWSFWVPERRLSGTVYNLFRPTMGLVSTDVFVWDDTSDTPWETPYYRPLWHVRYGPGDDPTNFDLPSGLSCERLEPLSRHRLRYADEGRISFDLVATGVHPPHPVALGFGTEQEGRGHFDQLIHVTGTLTLWGEELAVDCLSIRDRSWSPRSELGLMGGTTGYTYAAASPDLAFHVLAPSLAGGADAGPDLQPAVDGYLVRDGKLASVVSGRRVVTGRERGRPTTLVVELEDDLGRSLRAEGTCVSQFPFFGSPNVLAWFGLSRWTFDDGTEGWGEDQDCWVPPTAWRQTYFADRGPGR